MPKTYISDLKPGLAVTSPFLVAKKQLLPFRDASRGNYLSLTLADRTGRIEAKAWERGGDLFEAVEAEAVFHITGTVEDWRGSLQLLVTEVSAAAAEAIDLADYLPVSPRDLEEMKSELVGVLDGLGPGPIGGFMRDWFADPDFYRAYVTAPAAKHIHHSYLGGLLEHSLEVARLGGAVAGMYPRADRELLLAAALLHDVGKISEYRYQFSIDLTDHGRLLGHTVMGYEMVRDRARIFGALPESALVHLGHLILTHHGEMEFGAPVLPQTIEASILHHCDLLSGRVKQYDQILSGEGEGDWTEYDRMLGRYLYRGFRPTSRGEGGGQL